MEADLLRFYRVDLLDYWRTPRRLSTRRLMVLVRELPEHQGSRVRAITGEWSPTDDLLDQIRRNYVIRHSEQGDPGPHPLHPARRAAEDEATVTAEDFWALEDHRRRRKERLAAKEAG